MSDELFSLSVAPQTQVCQTLRNFEMLDDEWLPPSSLPITGYPQPRAVKGPQLDENLGGDVYLQW